MISEERPDYVKSWQEFRFLPGARDAIASLTRAGFCIIIVSNQSAINRGLATTKEVENIHRRMLSDIEKAGGSVVAVLYCQHKPEEGCDCRKPQPGLLEKASVEHGLDLSRCYLIGDKLSDIEAGLAVGCRCVLVLTGLGIGQASENGAGAALEYHVCADVGHAADWMIGVERRSGDEMTGSSVRG